MPRSRPTLSPGLRGFSQRFASWMGRESEQLCEQTTDARKKTMFQHMENKADVHPNFLNQVSAEQMAFFESLLLGHIECKVVSKRVGKGCLEVMTGMLRRGQPCQRNLRIYSGSQAFPWYLGWLVMAESARLLDFRQLCLAPPNILGLVCGNP